MNMSDKCKTHVDSCRFCWMCHHICPIGNATGLERNTARARALGLSLVNRIISVAKEKNCKIIYLEVRSKNNAAINLYEKCGFIRSGLRKNFYTNPTDDAFIMELNI